MITDFDDYLVHQTTEPVNQPAESNRNFYDRYWFSGFDRSGSFCFEAALGLYPNRHVMDAHFSIVLGDYQWAFHASCRASRERSEIQVGPFAIRIDLPMRIINITLVSNETAIECDLTFTATSAPTQEPKNELYEDGRLLMLVTRFTQVGHWDGYFSIDGKKTVVKSATTLGLRDRSWGIRPVGEPEAGAPGKMTTEPGVYWCWSPLIFENFSTQFATFEDPDGKATQVGGALIPLYRSPEDIPYGENPGQIEATTSEHSLHWHSNTRWPKAAKIDLQLKNNESYNIELEPILRFQMLGLGYQHSEWGHGVWQGELKVARDEWMLNDIDPLDYQFIHVHQICKATVGDQQGMGVLETLCFGRHDPSGFKEILDGAP